MRKVSAVTYGDQLRVMLVFVVLDEFNPHGLTHAIGVDNVTKEYIGQ